MGRKKKSRQRHHMSSDPDIAANNFLESLALQSGTYSRQCMVPAGTTDGQGQGTLSRNNAAATETMTSSKGSSGGNLLKRHQNAVKNIHSSSIDSISQHTSNNSKGCGRAAKKKRKMNSRKKKRALLIANDDPQHSHCQEENIDNDFTVNETKLNSSGGDCFDDVMWGKKGKVFDGKLRSSWLNDVTWISRHISPMESFSFAARNDNCERNSNKREDEQFVNSPCNDTFDEGHTHPYDETNLNLNGEKPTEMTKYDTIAQELTSMKCQLNAIKSRLQPCAAECAQALNTAACAQQKRRLATATAEGLLSIGESNTTEHEHDDDISYYTKQNAFEEARRVCNPFEELGEGRKNGLNRIFVNRSAMKLANIDAMLDFSLVTILAKSSSAACSISKQVVGGNAVAGSDTTAVVTKKITPMLKFVDLCGAPGGFTEYLFHKCHRDDIPVMGWGLSLRGSNSNGEGTPWKLEHLLCGDGGSGSNIRYRTSLGADGTGDVYNWENIMMLKHEIVSDLFEIDKKINNENTDCANGVDLVVVDGGFDEQRDSECQESITYRLVVCEVAAALSLLRQNGVLILKTFGSTHAASKKIMVKLFTSFVNITVVKPVLSRPASAERYVVCVGYDATQSLDASDILAWREEMLSHAPSSNNNHNANETVMDEFCSSIHNGEEYKNNHNCNDVEDEDYNQLYDYLQSMDHDLLKLNTKACFSILSCLQRMTLHAAAATVANAANSSTIDDQNGNYSNTNNSNGAAPMKPKARHIDIQMYKKAWGIRRKKR